MIFIKEIRHNYIYEKISEFLNSQNNLEYPLDPFQIIKDNGWLLVTYNENSSKFYEISKEGFSVYAPELDNFVIFYNKNRQKERIFFTLFHEIGHIILNHHLEFKTHILTSILETDFVKSFETIINYEVDIEIEVEADTFARNLLLPAYILANLECLDKKFICKQFKISSSAYDFRLSWIEKDYQNLIKLFNTPTIVAMEKSINDLNSHLNIFKGLFGLDNPCKYLLSYEEEPLDFWENFPF